MQIDSTTQLQTNEVIQQAIDAMAGNGGGCVMVPPGVYMMDDALRLRSGVHIVAQPGAVLKKAPGVNSRVKHFVGYGHYEFTVEEPQKFRPGMGIHLHDDRSGGFYDTTARIVARRGDWFFMYRMANHDYNPMLNAVATSLFPLIEADGVEDASAEGFTLDGNVAENISLNGCRGGAVFLIRSRHIRLQKLEVVCYNGEGISFQQCADVIIRNCDIHPCNRQRHAPR